MLSVRGTTTSPVMIAETASAAPQPAKTSRRAEETPVMRVKTTKTFRGTRKRDESCTQRIKITEESVSNELVGRVAETRTTYGCTVII